MRTYPRRLALATLLFAASAGLNAASLNWDPTATGGASGGGAGTWDTANAHWWNGTADTVWTNANTATAVFGGAGDSVTLATGVTANALTFNAGGYSLSGATLSLAGTTPTIAVTNAGDTATISDQLMGTAGLVKNGAGTLVLSGDNKFTGSITINAGVLELAAGGKLYDTAYDNTDVVTINTGGTWRVNDYSYGGVGQLADYAARRVINGGTIEVVGATQSSGQNFTVGANGGTFRYAPVSGSSVLTLAGNGNSQTTLNGLLTFDTSAAIVANGVLAGTGGITKTGTGTLTLGSANTFTGGTTASGGTLVLSNAAALQNSVLTPSGAAVVFDQSVTGNAFTVGGLAGSGSLALVNNASTPSAIALTVGNGNASGAYSGVLSGAGSLIKTGSGSMTLSGNNTFTGGIAVSAGRLYLSGSNTSAITVASGAIFGADATGSTTGLLTTNTGSNLAIAGGTPGSGFTANGVNFAGATTLTFDTTQTTGNTYTVVNYGAGGLTGLANLTAAARGAFADTGSAVTFTAGAIYTDTWNTTTGTWDSGTTANWSNGADSLFQGGDAVVFNNPASASVVTIAGFVNPGSITVNNTAGYTFSGTGSIGGSGTLTKQGSGTLILSTANTYSGGTTVSAGELQALTDTTAGAKTILGTGAVTVASGATLRIAAGSTSNAMSYANDFVLNGGTFISQDGVVTYTGTVSMTGNNTINVVYSGKNATFTNTVSSTGAITTSGSGSLIFNGGLTAGSISVTGGTLQFGPGTGNTTGAITLTGGVGLVVKSGATLTASGALGIANPGGANITVESGATFNAASGGFSYNTGTLKVDGALNFTGVWSLTTGATTSVTGAGNVSAGSFAVANYAAVTNAANLTVGGTFYLGNNTGQYGNYTQTAGTLTLNTTTGGAIRIGHWSSENSTLTLQGGVLNATGTAANIGWDGGGTLAVGGGTANFKGILLGSAGHAGNATVTVTGGTLNLGSGGIAVAGSGTNTVNLGAGTVGALANWSSSRAMTLTSATGTTFDTLDASDNTTARAITLSGVLSGATGKLIKTGAGTLTLSGANTYAGGTAVNGGTLAVSGTLRINGAGGVTIASGAALTLVSGSILAATGIDDGIISAGTLDGSGTLKLGTAWDTYGSTSYTLITGSGFSGLALTVDTTGSSVWSSAIYANGVVTLTAVPEPSAYGLLGAAALAGIAFVKRRKR